jgi:diguanylate cyclase (GGDEF)-like protein
MKVLQPIAVTPTGFKGASRTKLMLEPDSPLVLIIDDDPIDRVLVTESLADKGFRLIEADTATQGLRLIEELRPDLVLLDIMLPDIDGFAACSRLRLSAHGRHLPVLMMTGLDDVNSMRRAFHAGATDFVTKPLDPALLEFRLRYLLRATAIGNELRQSEALLASAQRIAQLGHFAYVPGRGFSAWNTQTHSVLGLAADVWITTLEDLLEHVDPADRLRISDALTARDGGAVDEPLEFRLTDSSGQSRTILQHSVRERHDNGHRIIGTFQNITERRLAEQKIHRLAYYDLITGLPNRILLERLLGEMLAEAGRVGEGVAALSIDLDHFQRVNDSVGHDVGNGLLGAIGQRLAACVRASGWRPGQADSHGANWVDVVARCGGDEFCIVLPGISRAADVAQVAQRIHESLQQPFNVAGQEFFITTSIGMAMHPNDGHDADTLLRHAELALAHAKRKGRDRAEFFDSQLNTRAQARLTMETNLRQAIGSEQLSLHYQPKLSVATGEVVGMEALVRWQHPTLGRIAPAEFIPVAEESGLILPLGEWILTEAARQLAAWRERGCSQLRCAVNLSAAQFRDRKLPAMLARILQQFHLGAEMLELELTESLLMEDAGAAQLTLRKLRDLGLTLAVDDFGTGYSSLHYLKRLPLDVLKIDQSFIRELRRDSDDAAIVEAVIAMAHSLRLGVVAEGVELDHQLDFLRALGCDEAQGYLFSKPLPAAMFADWVDERGGRQPWRVVSGDRARATGPGV